MYVSGLCVSSSDILNLIRLQELLFEINIVLLEWLVLPLVQAQFFQAEDGIRDCLLSRGLGDVYKRQVHAIFHHNSMVKQII